MSIRKGLAEGRRREEQDDGENKKDSDIFRSRHGRQVLTWKQLGRRVIFGNSAYAVVPVYFYTPQLIISFEDYHS
jgi:hypothetical protein